MKLNRRMARTCARTGAGASSWTVVRTSVDVTPMLSPHANTSAKNIHTGGFTKSRASMTMRVSCRIENSRPGRSSGITNSRTTLEPMLPTVKAMNMFARKAASPS